MSKSDIVDFVNSNPINTGESKQKYYARIAGTLGYSNGGLKRRFITDQIWKEVSFGGGHKSIAPNKAVHTHESKTEWDETKDGASLNYVGEQEIRTEQQAIDFFDIDTDKYEIDRMKFNAWDVTMKVDVWINVYSGKRYVEGDPFDKNDYTSTVQDHKRTNYQTTLWLKKKIAFFIKTPKVLPFNVKTQKGGQRFIIIGCLHRPFHDKKIWAKILQYISDNKKTINGIILNGDIVDLRSLSSHDEFIPEGIDLSMEYSDGLLAIMELKSAFGKHWKGLEKFFNYGNHEARFDRDLKAVRKYGSALPSPHEAMRLEEEGFMIQYDWKNGKVTLGNILDVYHGIYYGQNPSKAHLDKIPTRNHIFNHTHRFGNHEKAGFYAFNIGCLIDPMSVGFVYSHRFTKGDWKHGFCEAYIDSHGVDYVNPIPIIDGNFFAGGKFY